MNRQEFDAKWAGMTARERDMWVAEKVMGLEVASYSCYASLNGKRVEYRTDGGLLPRYTTDIAAAWQVLQEMQSLHFGFRILASRPWPRKVEIHDYNPCIRAVAEASNEPEAICKASLMVMEEVPHE